MSHKRVKNMKRDQQKAVFYNMSQVHTKMNSRSKQSQTIDRALRARSVYDGRSRKGKDKWMKNPNQVDIKKVDYAVAKKKYQAKKSKETMKTQKKEIRKINKKIRKTEEREKRVKKLIDERIKIGEKLHALDKKHPVKDRAYYEKREPLRKEVRDVQNKIKYQDVKGEIENEILEKKYHDNLVKSGRGTKKERDDYENSFHRAQDDEYIRKDLEKQKKQKEEDIRKTQIKHIHNRREIGHWSLSSNTVKQAERIPPQQRDDFVKDVKKWYVNRENRYSLNDSEQKEINRIKTKYHVDNALGAYVAITGSTPVMKNKSSPRAQPIRSPANKELDNTVKLSQVQKSLDTGEEKREKLNYLERNHKDSTEYLNKKRTYDKHVATQRKKIKTLTDDPNVRIEITKADDDHTDVNLIYKGSYVTATKKVPRVSNDYLRDIGVKN